MKRREYLGAAGAAAGLGFVGSVDATTYHQTLDVVDDLGVDNTGQTPIGDTLEPHLQDATRLEFPDGRYLVDQLVLYKLTNFSMVATGDATLVPGDIPTDGNVWIGGGAVRNLRFEGFTLDNTGPVGPTVGFSAYDGLVVRDIEKVGAHDSHRAAFGFSIWDSDGSGLVENLRATDGDTYHGSVGAVGIFTKTEGSLTFRNCRLADWGDNALYGSDATGPVHVEGGYYANSNVSQVRVSSPGSSVRDARIEVTKPRGGDANMRGLRVCDGPGPVEVENCEIVTTAGQGGGGIVVSFDGGSIDVTDTRLHIEPDYTTVGSNGTRTAQAILVDNPTGIQDPGYRRFSNTSITGGGTDYGAIEFRRGNNELRNVCINQTGDHRDGVVLDPDSTDNAIRDSSIAVPRAPITRNGAELTTSNNEFSGTCPTPSGVTYDQYETGAVELRYVPIPAESGRLARPTMATSSQNPTATIYTNYGSDAMYRFVTGNLPKLVRDFVANGALGIRFRFVPRNTDERYLTKLGLGVWDKEPENYWQFFEYLYANRGSISYGSVGEARTLLQDAGVRNYGWIPSLAAGDTYDHIVDADRAAANEHGITGWSDYPPILEFRDQFAAPQYAYDGGIKTWLNRRL